VLPMKVDLQAADNLPAWLRNYFALPWSPNIDEAVTVPTELIF
jgi:hypothetical protein